MKKITYQGTYMSVSEEVIGGHTFERVLLRSGVHVLPFDDGKILFMHEKRGHEEGSRWKLVSGWCDKEGHSPLDHAKEELEEEVGYRADTWSIFHENKRTDLTVSPQVTYYLCTNLEKINEPVHNPDLDCEVLGVKWFDASDIYKALGEGLMLPETGVLLALMFLRSKEVLGSGN